VDKNWSYYWREAIWISSADSEDCETALKPSKCVPQKGSRSQPAKENMCVVGCDSRVFFHECFCFVWIICFKKTFSLGTSQSFVGSGCCHRMFIIHYSVYTVSIKWRRCCSKGCVADSGRVCVCVCYCGLVWCSVLQCVAAGAGAAAEYALLTLAGCVCVRALQCVLQWRTNCSRGNIADSCRVWVWVCMHVCVCVAVVQSRCVADSCRVLVCVYLRRSAG